MAFFFRLGHTQAAQHYFDRFASRARDLENPSMFAYAYVCLGTLHREQGNADSDVDSNRRGLELYEGIAVPPERANLLIMLGDAEAHRGDYQSALEHLNRADKIATEHDLLAIEAYALRAMGEIHVQMGDYAKAIELHRRALKLFRDQGLMHAAGGEIGDLGVAYERLGDDAKAEECYQDSLRSAQRFGDIHERERLLTYLAEMALRRGNRALAIRDLHESLALSAQTGNMRFRANAFLALGRTYGSLKDFPEALKNLNAGLSAARSLRNSELELMALTGLGEVYLKTGRGSEAERAFRETLSIGEQTSIPDAVRLAQEGLGDLASRQGRLEEAVEHYRAAIAIIESVRVRLESSEFKSVFLSDKIGVYERIVDVLAQQDKIREALYFAEKKRARSFLETLAASRAAATASLIESNSLNAAEIEREMTRRGNLLIEYALGYKRCYVWVVTGTETVMARLPSRSAIERAIEQYRKLLATRSPQVEQVAVALYGMLIAPIASQLVPDQTLIIVADGVLQYLPFDTLMPAPGHFISENFTLTYIPSASVLAELSRRPKSSAPKELLAYGDPDFGTGISAAGSVQEVVRSIDEKRGLRFTRLPNTRAEVEGIAALYPVARRTMYLGRDATKTSVQQERLTDYKRIHFATHAFIDEARPERSGIVLSTADHQDPILRLKEVLALRLSADLVVLSAYQTGLGKLIRGEGVVGLTRAFLAAGTSRVVVSLWDVNDTATAELMKLFYQKMSNGMLPAQALRATEREMIRSNVVAYRDPYFWAAFVLVGEP